MKMETGITESNRQAVANELAGLIAKEYMLYPTTKNARRNIKGTYLNEKHKFFEFHLEYLNELIDKVAARIGLVGRYAYATLSYVFHFTNLTKVKREKNDGNSFIKKLLSERKSVIIYCRENMHQFVNDYKDYGAGVFITGVMDDHEKMTLVLRSHLN